MLNRIRYLLLGLFLFSGMVLFFSCDNNPQAEYYVGGGVASAKFGDTIITFQDTIVSNNLAISYLSSITFSNTKNNISNFQLSIETNINSDWVGSYPLNYYSYSNSASISGILTAKNGASYITDATHTGIFTINSYNPQLGIISGSFHFTAIRDSADVTFKSDTIVVSNGNFVANLKDDITQP